MSSQHPRQFGYFTPPPLPMSIAGELLAQMANQGVDVWHAGPFAAVRRGGGRPLAVRPRRLRRRVVRGADERRRHGQLHGDGAGPRPAARPAARPRTGRRAARPRGRPGLTSRPDPLLDRPGARRARASRPRRSSSSPATTRFHLRGAPVAAAIARDRAAGLTPVRDRRPSPGRRTPGRSTPIGELADVADANGLWLHVDAAYGGGGAAVDARRRARPGPRAGGFGDRRPAQVVLPGLRHRRPARPRRRAPRRGVRRPRAGVLPRRRDGRHGARRRRRRRRRPRGPRRPAQLLQAVVRGHPSLARAQALDVLEAPRDGRVRAARSRPTTTSPRTSPGAAPRPTTSRRSPTIPELSVVCFRHLPGGATARSRCAPPSSTPTRIASSARSRRPATAG